MTFRVGDIVESWAGVGRITHIRHNPNTQEAEKAKLILEDGTISKVMNVTGLKHYEPRNPADPFNFEEVKAVCECPECDQIAPAWRCSEGDWFVDCMNPDCQPAGGTFPVHEYDVKPKIPIIYNCYPHTVDGNPEIRGFIIRYVDDDCEELLVKTHPEDMQDDALKGFSDVISLSSVEWVVVE